MISQSDNTATDHSSITPAALKSRGHGPSGHSRPQDNRPMLSTLELFKLKADEPLRRRFLAADEAGRRLLLDSEVAALPRQSVEDALGNWTKPIAIETAEWFASAADLCRLMDHFRRRNDPTVLDILAINPGLRVDPARFPYVGYKGGSEPGVVNMTFLLRSRDGVSYALTAGWNDPASELDMDRFFALVQRALDAVPTGTPVPSPAAAR